jgi:hypothetical protein
MLRIGAACLLLFIILLIAIMGSAASEQDPPQNENAFIETKWTLINLAYPKDKRYVVFDQNLGSAYFTKAGPKPISNIKYRNGLLYFEVPQLHLSFKMRRVGERFDGKMTIYDGTDRRAPEAVRMTKSY